MRSLSAFAIPVNPCLYPFIISGQGLFIWVMIDFPFLIKAVLVGGSCNPPSYLFLPGSQNLKLFLLMQDFERKSIKVRNLIQILRQIIQNFWENVFHFGPSVMTIGIPKNLIRIVMNYCEISTIDTNRGVDTFRHKNCLNSGEMERTISNKK